MNEAFELFLLLLVANYRIHGPDYGAASELRHSLILPLNSTVNNLCLSWSIENPRFELWCAEQVGTERQSDDAGTSKRAPQTSL